ncbi:MAG TPA: hypothetical protein VFK14_14430 [Solirubrobacterales bacterium]|nr:hypothetical protein [Solirubrobacterales bacterium]
MAAAALAVFASQARQAARADFRPSSPPGIGALDVLLRLPDLPGYGFTDGSPLTALGDLRCDKINPANPQPELAHFLRLDSPAGCSALYQRLYKMPGRQPEPAFLGTAAVRFRSVAAAEEGLAVADQLLSHLILDELPEEAQPPATIGDATRLFHWRHSGIFSEEEEDCSFLFWRFGSTLSAIFVPGGSPSVNDRIATELAERQQRHVEAPVATKPAEFDDTEVSLEDPALEFPTYWLGSSFQPGRQLAALHLIGSYHEPKPSSLRPRVGLAYADHPFRDRYEEIFVDLYSTDQWRRLRDSGRHLPDSLRCSSSPHPLNLRTRTAVAFSGSEGLLRKCRRSEPTAWTLRMRLGPMVIVAQTSTVCAKCFGPGHGGYNSLAGMKAIARGLVLRHRPPAERP